MSDVREIFLWNKPLVLVLQVFSHIDLPFGLIMNQPPKLLQLEFHTIYWAFWRAAFYIQFKVWGFLVLEVYSIVVSQRIYWKQASLPFRLALEAVLASLWRNILKAHLISPMEYRLSIKSPTWRVQPLLMKSCFFMNCNTLMLNLSPDNLSSQSVNLEIIHLKLKHHGASQACNPMTLGLLQWSPPAEKFGLKIQRTKREFHYLTLGGFHTTFLSKAKADKKTTMATYVLDFTAKGMKIADLSPRMRSHRIYRGNEPMPRPVILSWKAQTLRYFTVWEPWSNALVKMRLYRGLPHHLEINIMWQPLSVTLWSWNSKSLDEKG